MFGWSVAFDGDTVLVGADDRSGLPTMCTAGSGAAYVFTLRNAKWMGSGEVYVFERSGDAWSFQQLLAANHPRAEDYFGNTLALTPDVLLVGATGDASGASGANADGARSDAPAAGAVYLFEERDAGWSRAASLKASNASGGARFSDGLALDGETVVVGAGSESSSGMGVTTPGSGSGADDTGAVYVVH